MVRPESIRKNKWEIAPILDPGAQKQLERYHPILSQILYNRDLKNPAQIQAFLDGRYLESNDPYLLADVDQAVKRICDAIADDEMIVIYGDFDADGVTATVLLTEALRGLGLGRSRVRPYIPDRVDEGYGLNTEAIKRIKDFGASLIITVDCGIRSVAEVEYANELGLDVIITDHHSLGRELPPAKAIINPKRNDSNYPDRMLAGVGIAFKLAQALYSVLPERVQIDLDSLLDLVAVGTVADLAPLHNENRVLVIAGLRVLNQLKRPGLSALAAVSGLKPGSITAESIGFALGPRINAAGRLDHAYSAARLLAVNNDYTARQLAEELNSLNRKRQQLTAELGELAEGLIDLQDQILIASDERFQSGLVGLVASRLAEKNYRPAIIIEKGPEMSRGSCRSIPEFHITNALDLMADLLVRHGGHAQAAGFTVLNENLDRFTSRMQEIATQELSNQELIPVIEIDAEIDISDVDWALYENLALLEPTGQGNPTPVFLSRNVEVVYKRTVGLGDSHLQLRLADANGSYKEHTIPAIAFRQGAWDDFLPKYIDVVYSIGLNEWNGQRNLQLVIKDMRQAAF
jgi:single-stranded-DNA-specific exonuclease